MRGLLSRKMRLSARCRLVGPAEKAGETGRVKRAQLVLKAAGAVQMLNAFFDRLIEADNHGCRSAQAGFNQRALRGEVFLDAVLELAVTPAKIVRQNLRSASGDPAHAGILEPRSGVRVAELRVIGEIHELGDRKRVELDAVAIAGADGAEEITVVIERQMRIEAAVEGSEVTAEHEQFVEFGEDLILRQHIPACLAGQLVESAIVALRHADIGVVDDAHDHVCACRRRMKARAHLRRHLAQFRVRALTPERQRIVRRNALACGNSGANVSERRCCGGHASILVRGGTRIADGCSQHLPRRAQAAADRSVHRAPVACGVGVLPREEEGVFRGNGHL